MSHPPTTPTRPRAGGSGLECVPDARSSPEGGTAHAILVVNAAQVYGAALCDAFAAERVRLAIEFSAGEREQALRLARRAACRGAVAFPVEREACASEGEGPEEALVRRVVEDFGRLDAVVYPLESLEELHPRRLPKPATHEPAARPGCPEPLRDRDAPLSPHALARAAAPHLRAVRPVGHFILVVPAPLEATSTGAGRSAVALFDALRRDVAALSADVSGASARPNLSAVLLSAGEAADAPPASPEAAARFVRDLTARQGLRGEVLLMHTR